MVLVIFYSPLKLAKRITLGVSRITLRCNITRRRRIKLALYPYGYNAYRGDFFYLSYFAARIITAARATIPAIMTPSKRRTDIFAAL